MVSPSRPGPSLAHSPASLRADARARDAPSVPHGAGVLRARVSSRTSSAAASPERMASSAPTSRTSASFDSSRSTATIRAPESARRICTAMCPRPPTPITTAVDPGTSRWSERLIAWWASGRRRSAARPRADRGRSGREALDPRADRLHPAGVLVPERERKLVRQRPGRPLHHVKVGVAGPAPPTLTSTSPGPGGRAIREGAEGAAGFPHASAGCGRGPLLRGRRTDAPQPGPTATHRSPTSRRAVAIASSAITASFPRHQWHNASMSASWTYRR
jgi:hypothetical protein